MRSAAWAPWRFSHRGQNPGPLTLREILDSGRCPAKGRIAAAASDTTFGSRTRRRGLMPREALTESAMARTMARSWPFDGLTAAGLQSYQLPDRSIDR